MCVLGPEVSFKIVGSDFDSFGFDSETPLILVREKTTGKQVACICPKAVYKNIT